MKRVQVHFYVEQNRARDENGKSVDELLYKFIQNVSLPSELIRSSVADLHKEHARISNMGWSGLSSTGRWR
ncbi:MAG: hypothetical protein GY832_31100 [Chloroflexi bacterium]|nr:hypothetical protein [Chloroflexota bacterium]